MGGSIVSAANSFHYPRDVLIREPEPRFPAILVSKSLRS
jgi:hypothetical protein